MKKAKRTFYYIIKSAGKELCGGDAQGIVAERYCSYRTFRRYWLTDDSIKLAFANVVALHGYTDLSMDVYMVLDWPKDRIRKYIETFVQ